MLVTDFCNTSIDFENRRKRFNERKLAMFKVLKDSLERQLASVSASIQTIELQLKQYDSEGDN